MECRVCGADLDESAKFCINCGNPVDSVEEIEQTEDILEEAAAKAQEVFNGELEESGLIDPDVDNSTGKRKSTRERLKEMGSAVRKGTDSAIELGKKVSVRTGKAVETSKVIGKDVGKTAKKVGKGVHQAVKRTRKSMDELGQVGVIITQRALDVVRASLRAVEIVDEYLAKTDATYEVGNFITGIGVPPYLEIEFHKRSTEVTVEEKGILDAMRKGSITETDLRAYIESVVEEEIDERAQAEPLKAKVTTTTKKTASAKKSVKKKKPASVKKKK